jgi:hypothetical protein
MGGVRHGASPAPTFDRLHGLAKRMPLTCFGIVLVRPEPDRRARHRRLRQQVVSGARRAGKGQWWLVRLIVPVRCWPSPTSGASSRSPISARRRPRQAEAEASAGPAAAGLAAGAGHALVRHRYLAHGRLGRSSRQQLLRTGADDRAPDLILAALLLPLLGASAFARGRGPTCAKASPATAVLLACVVQLLAPVLAGARPELVLFEPCCPACRSPSASSRWACSSR